MLERLILRLVQIHRFVAAHLNMNMLNIWMLMDASSFVNVCLRMVKKAWMVNKFFFIVQGLEGDFLKVALIHSRVTGFLKVTLV